MNLHRIYTRVRKFLGLKETVSPTELYGEPVDWARVFGLPGLHRPVAPLFGPETRPDRNSALRTLTDHHRARNLCRHLVETNSNASGLVDRLVDFVVGAGSTTDLHPKSETETLPARLEKQVKQVVDAFRDHNDWPGVEEEMVRRLIVDGEFFLRLIPDDDTITDSAYVNTTTCIFVEPAQVIPPAGESHDGPWSFGVYIPDGHYKPVAFNVHDYQTKEDEEIPAALIIHGKADGLRNAKRGIPLLWAALEELQGSARLRYAAREGEKARQAISYFRQHDAAAKSVITSLQDELATDSYTRYSSLAGQQDVMLQKMEPGSVIDIPSGLKPVPPPTSPTTGTEAIVRLSLEAVAARMGLPLWAVSASADQANFATALTAESPMVKAIERWQRKISGYSDDAQTRAVEIAQEQGLLPEDTLDRVDLLVTLPSPITRNKREESERRALLRAEGVISLTTWRSEEGYDEREAEKISQERITGPEQLPDRVTDSLDQPNAGATTPTDTTQVTPGTGTGDVQDTALNGAQVASLLEIVNAITAGTLPPEAGRAVISAAFPALRPEQLDAIINNLTAPGSAPVPPGSVPVAMPVTQDTPTDAPSATPNAQYAALVNRPESS